MRHPFIKLFHLSNLLQMPNNPNDPRRVNAEFFCDFSCSSMIALNWSLSTSHGSPSCSSFSRLSPLQNFLSHHWTVCLLAVPGPNVLLMFWVVFAALWPILNSNKKTPPIFWCQTKSIFQYNPHFRPTDALLSGCGNPSRQSQPGFFHQQTLCEPSRSLG